MTRILLALLAIWIDAAFVTSSGAWFHSLAASTLKLWAAIFSFAESLNTLFVWFRRSWVLFGLAFQPSAQAIPAPWREKKIWDHLFWQRYPQKNFSSFYFASRETIEVEIRYRQTDRQTDKLFDTIYGCVWIFSSS